MEQESKGKMKVSKSKLLKKENFFICILLGVLLLVIVWPMEKKESTKNSSAENTVFRNEFAAESRDEQVVGLEQELEGLLRSMEGVGENKVMITWSASGTTSYLTTDKTSEIEGVVVCAKGAGNGKVAKNISEVIQALFGIEAHKIKIVKMI